MKKRSFRHPPDFVLTRLGPAELNLVRAIRAEDEERIRSALERPVAPIRPYAYTESRLPLLMWVAQEGAHVGAVRSLIEQGADPNAVIGSTSLLRFVMMNLSSMDLSHQARQLGVIVYLITEGGADVNQVGREQDVPLQACCALPDEAAGRIAELLIEKGAILSWSNSEHASLLHFAAAAGNIGVFRTLLSKGLDHSLRNAQGATVLEVCYQPARPHREEAILETQTRLTPGVARARL